MHIDLNKAFRTAARKMENYHYFELLMRKTGNIRAMWHYRKRRFAYQSAVMALVKAAQKFTIPLVIVQE